MRRVSSSAKSAFAACWNPPQSKTPHRSSSTSAATWECLRTELRKATTSLSWRRASARAPTPLSVLVCYSSQAVGGVQASCRQRRRGLTTPVESRGTRHGVDRCPAYRRVATPRRNLTPTPGMPDPIETPDDRQDFRTYASFCDCTNPDPATQQSRKSKNCGQDGLAAAGGVCYNHARNGCRAVDPPAPAGIMPCMARTQKEDQIHV